MQISCGMLRVFQPCAQRMGLAVNPCVAPAAGVVSKPMLAAGDDFVFTLMILIILSKDVVIFILHLVILNHNLVLYVKYPSSYKIYVVHFIKNAVNLLMYGCYFHLYGVYF